MDLSGQHHFATAITDNGICHVLNGDAMTSTFEAESRLVALSSAFDRRESATAEKIYGTGQMYQKTFWIDVADRQDYDALYSKDF